MASLSTSKTNGHKRLLVVLDEKRIIVHLGKISLKTAQSIRAHAEHLAEAKQNGTAIPPATAAWLDGLDLGLRRKLERIGLAEPKERKAAVPLAAFIDEYLSRRVDIKDNTKEKLEIVRDRLIEHFGTDRDMASITAGDAEDFRLYLVKVGNGENTIRRTIGRARQLFKAAIKRELIPARNPFEGLPSAVRGNPARFHFVTREETQKLIDAATDTEWKLLIALARFGGLRTPSEPLALTWDRVNWEHSRILIHCPKLERLQGKGDRWIPLFPELLPYLQQAFDEAKPGSIYVIMRYRDSRVNLRTQLGRIAVKAGIDLWEKPWQNMRASRQTELAETYPGHVVSKWMGNSEPVANEHYLNVTDEHFKRAIEGDGLTTRETTRETTQNVPADKNGIKTTVRGDSLQVFEDSGIVSNLPDSSIMDQIYPAPRVGDEHSAKLNQKQGISEPTTRRTTRGIPESGQKSDPSGLDTDKLAEILKAIPSENRAAFLRALANQIDKRTR